MRFDTIPIYVWFRTRGTINTNHGFWHASWYDLYIRLVQNTLKNQRKTCFWHRFWRDPYIRLGQKSLKTRRKSCFLARVFTQYLYTCVLLVVKKSTKIMVLARVLTSLTNRRKSWFLARVLTRSLDAFGSKPVQKWCLPLWARGCGLGLWAVGLGLRAGSWDGF